MWVYGIIFHLSLPTVLILIFLNIESHIGYTSHRKLHKSSRQFSAKECMLAYNFVGRLRRYCLAMRCEVHLEMVDVTESIVKRMEDLKLLYASTWGFFFLIFFTHSFWPF